MHIILQNVTQFQTWFQQSTINKIHLNTTFFSILKCSQTIFTFLALCKKILVSKPEISSYDSLFSSLCKKWRTLYLFLLFLITAPKQSPQISKLSHLYRIKIKSNIHSSRVYITLSDNELIKTNPKCSQSGF